jgi:hypothetical protein
VVTEDGTRYDITDNFARFIVPNPEAFEVIDRWNPAAPE